MLTYLFFVTSLGVPQSITRLNLFSLMGSSSPSFFVGVAFSVPKGPFFIYGCRRDYLRASIFFCFSDF
jgi:hypothetical protein